MVSKLRFHFYLSMHRSLPVLISGRGVRLISSATVKGRGEEEERGGVQTFGGQLVLMTFRMQHPGSAANITKGIISIRVGHHARGGGIDGDRIEKRPRG